MRILATRGFFERDLHRVAQVAAPEYLAPAACAAPALLAEHVAEDVAKRFGEAAKTLGTRGATAQIWVHTGVAVLVVRGPLLRDGQHLVGLLGFLEFLFRNLGVRPLVAVRVVLHRMLAIRLLDFLFGCILGNTQGFVIVSFGHCRSQSARKKSRTVCCW